MKASASPGTTPAFCGSAPVLTSMKQGGRRPWRSISRASASARRGRSTVSIASKSAHRVARLVGLQRADEVEAQIGLRSCSAGYFASASCTRFSPKRRWPGGERRGDRRLGLGLRYRDQRDRCGIAPGRARRGGDARAHRGEIGGDRAVADPGDTGTALECSRPAASAGALCFAALAGRRCTIAAPSVEAG